MSLSEQCILSVEAYEPIPAILYVHKVKLVNPVFNYRKRNRKNAVVCITVIGVFE